MDKFQKASCLCHLELCFYTLPEPLLWWQNWMPLILNTSSTSRVLWRTQSPASYNPQTHTHTSTRRKLCESGLPGGLERDWSHDSQQRGHSKPWPQQHQSHALQAGWGCLHSSSTHREGFVFSALAKSNYPRSTTSCFNAVLTTCFLRDQKHLSKASQQPKGSCENLILPFPLERVNNRLVLTYAFNKYKVFL